MSPDASMAVMRGSEGPETNGLAMLAGRVDKVGGSQAKQQRCCPFCTNALSTFAMAGIDVDSCPAHGTWFDANEVKQMLATIQKLAKKHAPTEPFVAGRDPARREVEGVGFFDGAPALAIDAVSGLYDFFFGRRYRDDGSSYD